MGKSFAQHTDYRRCGACSLHLQGRHPERFLTDCHPERSESKVCPERSRRGTCGCFRPVQRATSLDLEAWETMRRNRFESEQR